MPVGDDNVLVRKQLTRFHSQRAFPRAPLFHCYTTPPNLYISKLTATQQATSLDPALIDRSGDPERRNPSLHGTGPPAYLHSEGKATHQDHYLGSDEHDDFPTEEEMKTLHRVPAPIPWKIYTIAFVELVERMSYYGTTAVYSNFIAQERGTRTGAAIDPDDEDAQPGALGLGK